MGEEMKRVCRESGLDISDLPPSWDAQIVRTVVPCLGTDRYQWRRIGQVVTLGTLVMALGKMGSADHL